MPTLGVVASASEDESLGVAVEQLGVAQGGRSLDESEGGGYAHAAEPPGGQQRGDGDRADPEHRDERDRGRGARLTRRPLRSRRVV